MTEKQAVKEGLTFTGKYESLYSCDIAKVKQEAARIRSLGFRAVVVDEQGGKSVYAEPAYEDYRWAQVYLKTLTKEEELRNSLLAKHAKELAEFEDKMNIYRKHLAEVEAKIGRKVVI